MKVVITANQVPFMPGGADALTQGLWRAVREAGHEAELVRLPFQFHPPEALERLMAFSENLDLSNLNGHCPDRVISLQFPGYACRHPDHRLWLMHQHRSAYELYDGASASAEEQALVARIRDFDQRALERIRLRYTIAANVSRRLSAHNGLASTPLYHPPQGEAHFYRADDWGYIFAPSRLEHLKRQWLLIDAAAYMRSPLKILIAGDGGQASAYQRRIDEAGVGDRVKLTGRLSEAQKLASYAHSLAVFFGPWDEDLGYITLEAMLAAKPVITCTDSGGPLEFVHPDETGLVVDPDPRAIAQALDGLWNQRRRARALGDNARQAYQALNLSWSSVAEALLADAASTPPRPGGQA